MKTVVFFGTYNPDYPRNRFVRQVMENAGMKLISVNRRGKGLLKYFFLARDLRAVRNYDSVFIGFPGHLSVIIARLVTHKPIYFDAFISLYDTYVEDRQTVSRGSFRAWQYRLIDRLACAAATKVIVDTPQHAEYFVDQLKVKKSKLFVAYVGTDTTIFTPPLRKRTEPPFIIFWHGKYSPLHGVQQIIEAARLLAGSDIEFHLLGGGGMRQEMEVRSRSYNLTNVHFLPTVSYADLPSYIQKACLCLGIFGSSSKVGRVVPNKIYEYMACGKAVITAESAACRSLLAGADVWYTRGREPAELVDLIQQVRHTMNVTNYYSEKNRTISQSLSEKARNQWQELFGVSSQ